MKYPQILLLPLMMFADYFLTVLGAVQREKKYSKHFVVQHYELNPIWQKSIAAKKWFNPRHAFSVIVLNAILIALLEFGGLEESSVITLLGVLLTLYAMILGRHINNLLVFRYVDCHPDEISGQVSFAHTLTLSISLYQTLIVLIPLILVATFSRSLFAIGGAIGVGMFCVISLRWRRKARRQRKAAQNAPPISNTLPTSA